MRLFVEILNTYTMNIWPVYYLTTLAAAVAAVIREGPEDGNFTVGSNVTLLCLIEGKPKLTAWIDTVEGKTMFYNKEKAAAGTKYSNFYLASSSNTHYTDFSLHIINANVTDDGSYSCQADDEVRTATIAIEAPPTLYLSINATPAEDESDKPRRNSTRMVTIYCKASGAKPAAKLRLKISDGPWIEQPDTQSTQKDMLFDSHISEDYLLSVNDMSVTCQAYGQISIQPVNLTKTLSLPTCNISLEAQDVICNCDAFPPVYKYLILINGEDSKELKKVRIGDYLSADFTCVGINILGSAESRTLSISDRSVGENQFGTISWIITSSAFIVAVVITVLCVLFCRRRHGGFTYTGIRIPALTDPEVKAKIPNGLHRKFWNIATKVGYDIEIFAIESLNVEKSKMEEIVERNNTFEDKVQATLENWVLTYEGNVSAKELYSISNKSDVCAENNSKRHLEVKDFNICCSKSASSKCNKAPDMDQILTEKVILAYRSPEFVCFLERLATCIGKAGITRLQTQYSVALDYTDTESLSNTEILREMVAKDKVDNTMESLESLKESLKSLNLLSAAKETTEYMNNDCPLGVEKLILKVGATIKVDWEILAIENLNLTEAEVRVIIKENNDCEDQVIAALTKWFQNKKKVTDTTLLRILQKSHVCMDFQCNDCSTILEKEDMNLPPDKTKVTLHNELHNEQNQPDKGSPNRESVGLIVKSPREVFLMFECIGTLIGNTGALKLAEAFLLPWESTCIFFPGKEILSRLTEAKHLEDNIKSAGQFRRSLSKCHLFRALKAVDECLQKDLQDFINIVSHKLPCDWEIFAIKSLALKESDVQTISRNGTEHDQVKRALNDWAERNKKWSSKYKLLDIMVNSNVCKDSNNGCIEIFKELPYFDVPQLEAKAKMKIITDGETDQYLQDLFDKQPSQSFEYFRYAFSAIIKAIFEKAEPLNTQLLTQKFGQDRTNVKRTDKLTLIKKEGVIPADLIDMLNMAIQQSKLLKNTHTTVLPGGTVKSFREEQSNDTGSEERSAIHFYTLLGQVAEIIGAEGASEISKKYNLNMETLNYSDVFGRPVCFILAILICEKMLENQEPSLQYFKKALKECYLIRAMYMIDEYVTKPFINYSNG